MRKSSELLLIRYISVCILMLQLFIINENKTIASVVFILMFIINSNIRVFYFKKQWQEIISIIIELICIPIAQISFGGSIIFYLIGTSIDIFTLKNSKITYSMVAVIVTLLISNRFTTTVEESFIYLGLLGILFMLLNYISKLYDTKKEAHKLYDKLKVSEEKLIDANNELESYLNSVEELTLLKERNRISREIHDSVGHALSTAMIQLSAMETIAEKEGSSLKIMAGNLRTFVNESFQDVKKAVRELKPDEYDNYQGVLRLQEVCKNFEKISGIEVKAIISKGEWNLSSKQINHLYRITQEVLSNSLRHGKATVVKVVMNFTDDEFILSFNDNGVGIDKIQETGVGLKSIRERAVEINGIVDMKSSRNKGFFVKIIVPKEVEV